MVWTRGWIGGLALACAACAGGEGRDDGASSPTGTLGPGSTGADSSTGVPTSTTELASTGPASTSTDASTTAVGDTSSSGAVDSSSTSEALTGTTGEALTGSTGEGPDTTTSGASSTGPEPGCGDGVVDAPEACDDGNQVDGDGCNVDCQPSGQVLWSVLHGGVLGLVDEALGCAVDGTGSIHVAGFVAVTPTDDDLWLRKYSAAGDVLWTQTYAGSAVADDQGRAVVVDAAELVYVAGLAKVLNQDNNAVVRKHAADGSPQWTKTYNGAAALGDVASGAVLTPTGDLVVGGATITANNASDTWLRKYTPAGATLWTRTYDGAAHANDATNAVAVTADGYLYAAGYEAVLGEGNNIWLGKYDPDGNLLWSRLYNGGVSKSDFLHAAVAMDDGGVVVCGYEGATGIPWKSFLRRYDPNGLILWTEVHDGTEAAGALCYGLDRAPGGDLLFAGATMQAGQREPWLRRLGPDGAPRWSTVVTGAGASASHARCLRPAPDGTLVAAGALDDGIDGRDIWVARLSP